MNIDAVVQAYLVACKAKALSAYTLRNYRGHLTSFQTYLTQHGRTTISEITERDIEAWLAERRDQSLRGNSLRTLYGSLKAFFHWARRKRYITSDPLDLVDRPKDEQRLHTPLSDADVERLLDAIPDDALGKRDRALVLLAVDTGARIGELLGLTLSRVFADDRKAIVVGKGNKEAYIYWHRITAKALADYLAGVPVLSPTAPLFRNRQGASLTYSGALVRLHRYAKVAGVQVDGWHQFRRTFAVSLDRDGVTTAQLRRFMRHGDIEMTARYLNSIGTEAIRDIHERHHSLMRRLAEREGGTVL